MRDLLCVLVQLSVSVCMPLSVLSLANVCALNQSETRPQDGQLEFDVWGNKYAEPMSKSIVLPYEGTNGCSLITPHVMCVTFLSLLNLVYALFQKIIITII